MKQTRFFSKIALAAAAAAIVITTTLQAAVIPTYDGTSGTWWNLNANGGLAIQWFTVPEGEVGIQFEFYIEKGAYNQPAAVNLAIYSANAVLQGLQSTLASDFGASGAWISADNLDLNSGSYYAVVWTNNEGFKPFLHAHLIDPSGYADGYAASNSGPLGAQADFWGRLTTTQAIPEPINPATTTALFLIGGGFYHMMRRRNALRTIKA